MSTKASVGATGPEVAREEPPQPPATMRAVVADTYGDQAVTAVREVPTPIPAEGEVLVQVAASSLNALDWHFLTGTPWLIRLTGGLRKPKRIVHGADVAGTVVAVGSGVTRWSVGDEVFGECEGGGFGQFLTVSAEHLAAKPAAVSFEAAGATPVAGLTAIQALRTHADVQPGDRVLINGAAGGVGTFAVQIAKALGAEVTAVCSTRNVEMVRSLGADEVIDYTTVDFTDGGPRFDVMLDGVGNRTPRECLSVLLPDARYVVISGPKRNRLLGPVGSILRSALAFWRADPSFHQFTASADAQDQAMLAQWLASGEVAPQIQRTVDLDGVAEALAELGTGHLRAKVVVLPG